MDNSWEGFEPSPIEFMHGELLKQFHSFREQHSSDHYTKITGHDLNNLIVEAKRAVYTKYKKLNLDKAIPKNSL